MPRKNAPKTQDWGDGKYSSWDKETVPKPVPDRKYNRRCRVCGVHLTTHAEDKIGVHIRCVQESSIRQARLAPIVSGRQSYGSNR